MKKASTTIFNPCAFAAVLLLLLSSSVFASLYPKEIQFQHILENRDIVLGEVRAIFQDSQDFIWFGGWQSLVRYDGYDVKPLYETIDVDGKQSLVPVTMTITMFEDSRHIMWVGTAQGLLRYDPVKNELRRLKNMPDQPIPIGNHHISGIKEAPTGEILVAGLYGFYIVDPDTLQYEAFAVDQENLTDSSRPYSPTTPCVFIDTDSQIWICTEKGLDKFDLQSRSFSHVVPDATNSERAANWIKDIEQDEKGNFWLGTELGILYYNPVTGDFKRYKHDINDPNSVAQDNIWDILIDSQGRVWFATDGGGLNLYNPEKDNFISYRIDKGKDSSIAFDVVRTIMEDASGDLWVGFYPTGVDFFDQSTTATTAYQHNPSDPNSLSNNSVMSISEDALGNLWLGTDGGGLDYFDRENGIFKNFQTDPNDPHTIATNAILSTWLDSEGILWLGHWGGGVTRYDIKNNTFTRIPVGTPKGGENRKTSKALNSPHVWSIYEDNNNDLWFGTHTGGLNKYDRKTGTFTHYWADVGKPNALNSEWVWTTFEDSQNNFWVGTNSGLALMDRKRETFTRFIPNPNDPTSLSNWSVLAITEDKQHRLWIGTTVGLNLFDYQSRTFTHITVEDGLNNDSIRRILEDEQGTLWLGTANGVSSYNPDTGKIKNYNRDGGELVGSFNYGSGVVSNTGEIIFGGTKGMRVYKPDELQNNPNIPPIVFTKLQIYSDIIEVGGPDGILHKDLNHLDTLKLDYTKSMFEIDFAALNYRDPSKNQYAYKLEGFDDEWLEVGTKRSAKYTNLDAGTYKFRVKASNNDGVWNKEGRSITIVQLPPWWETWWAYTLYVLILATFVLGAIQYQRRKRQRVEEQNRILELKVAERTAELRKKTQDIQAMLSNIRQGLFSVEKNGIIHPEYSQFLEHIFETTEVAGKNFMDFLFSRSHMGSNMLDQIKEATKAILDEDAMNFEFNSHLFFDEYDADIEGQRKHLSLDWTPIVDDHKVTRLMISVRDVTELKKIESEARIQRRELDIISQLLNIQARKFNNFEKSISKFIQENRNKITTIEHPTAEVLALLFRNMHTIKGNCRTYGFTYMSEVAHEAETMYSDLKSSNIKQWNKERLLRDLTSVEEVMEEYADIFHRVLGRDENAVTGTPHDPQTVTTPEENSSTIPLEEVLADIINSLESIATQLGKQTPEIKVNSGDIQFVESEQELLTNIFAHILRNCVDHGIEKPQEREKSGKPIVGKIDLSVKTYADYIDIHVQDDGRGLNISKLKAIGVKLDKWNKGAKVDVESIVQLIFDSGISTADVVTDISGRGVGMDAVKQYLLENGGDVNVNILDETPETKDFVHFETIITLPTAFYKQPKKTG